MKFKKLGKKLIIPVAMCMILAGGVMPSFANNNENKPYSFFFGKFGDTDYTLGRAKYDKSSSYMECNRLAGNYKFSGSVVASYDGRYIDLKGTPSYKFYNGTARKMTNYIRENNFTAASVKAKMNLNPVNVVAAGYWSPDSK